MSDGGEDRGKEDRRSWNPQVLAALIALVGVMFTAVLSNWDKLFGLPKPSPTIASTQPKPVADSVPSPEGLANSAKPPVPAAETPSLDGLWTDTDGYAYRFRQEGQAISYTQLLDGKPISQGDGTIDGRALRYAYRADGGQGRCSGTLSADGHRISGRCTDEGDGSSWSFAITR